MPKCGKHVDSLGNIRRLELGGKCSDPIATKLVGRLIGVAALAGQDDELRFLVVRVVSESHQAVADEFVDDALYALTGNAGLLGDLRDRASVPWSGNGAEHLPARARQANRPDDLVAPCEKPSIQAEDFEDQAAKFVCICGHGSLSLIAEINIDNMLSLIDGEINVKLNLGVRGMKTESIFRVDKFAVPAQSRDAFMARLQVTHKTLGAADGCVQNLVLEQVSGAGEFNVVTIVEWRDTAAYENARQAAQQRQKENGFDPQSYFRELGIKADLGNYTPMSEVFSSAL